MNQYCFLNGCVFDQVGTHYEFTLPQHYIYVVGYGRVPVCPRHVSWLNIISFRTPQGKYVLRAKTNESPHFDHIHVSLDKKTAKKLRLSSFT